MPVALKADLFERIGNETLGACALDPDCAEANELGRLCSFHTLYFCGHHEDCALGDDGVATDEAVARAIANVVDQSKVLLVFPVSDAAAGFAALETLLPGYMKGLGDAVRNLERGTASGRGKKYDRAGEHTRVKTKHPRERSLGIKTEV